MIKKTRILTSMLLALVAAEPTWAFSTKNGIIYDSNNNVVELNGIAWIGFQDQNFLGGLSNVPFNPLGTQNGVMDILTAPWTVPSSGIASQANGVSFKSIRLPIQPGIWRSANTVQSPFNFSATDSANPTQGNGPFCDWTAGADGGNHCKKSLSAPDLLTATINQFNQQNIYVMLDFHHRPGLGDNYRDGTVVASDYSLQNYHDDVANFAKTAPANVIGIDLYNEPHKLYWFQDNTQITPVQPAWIKVIAAGATAAYDNNQNVLLFVEAPGGTVGNDPSDPMSSQNTTPICLPTGTTGNNPTAFQVVANSNACPAANPVQAVNIGSNWGENFRSLLDTTQAKNGVARFNATSFRSKLIKAIQTNNFSATDPNLIANWLLGANNDGNNGHLVFAPHLYGAAVAGWQSDAHDSPYRFGWNFGFFQDTGFPFVIGELGYDVQVPQTGGQDFFLNSVAPYLISKNIPNNLFFWTWNNADVPAGVRANDADLTLFAWKEQDLHNLYYSNATPPAYGELCITVPTPTDYTGTQLPVITAVATTNYTFNLTGFNTPVCLNNVAVGTYTLKGSSILNSNGINYISQQTSTTTVSQNATQNATVLYAQEPVGTLQLSVTGSTNCPISANQQFTVKYTKGQSSSQILLTGTTPANATLAVGTYALSVTPTTLPSNPQCTAQLSGNSVTVTANNTTQNVISYVFTPPSASCSIKAQCSTWGTPSDSWAGSSCNIYIKTAAGMTAPAILSLPTQGISAITGVWNATASLVGNTVALTLTNPVSVTNIGFNANGVIQLPSQASLSTNGQTLVCPVTQ